MTDLDKARAEGQQQEAEGTWKNFAGRVREAWGALTDDDVQRFQGQREQLIGRIQEKTGEARTRVAEKLEEIAQDLGYDLE